MVDSRQFASGSQQDRSSGSLLVFGEVAEFIRHEMWRDVERKAFQSLARNANTGVRVLTPHVLEDPGHDLVSGETIHAMRGDEQYNGLQCSCLFLTGPLI